MHQKSLITSDFIESAPISPNNGPLSSLIRGTVEFDRATFVIDIDNFLRLFSSITICEPLKNVYSDQCFKRSPSVGRQHTFTVQFDVEPRHVRFELSATDADNVDKSYEVCHDDNTQNSITLEIAGEVCLDHLRVRWSAAQSN